MLSFDWTLRTLSRFFSSRSFSFRSTTSLLGFLCTFFNFLHLFACKGLACETTRCLLLFSFLLSSLLCLFLFSLLPCFLTDFSTGASLASIICYSTSTRISIRSTIGEGGWSTLGSGRQSVTCAILLLTYMQ